MQPNPSALNPFALLLNPQAVFAALEMSGSLNQLQSRVCRPLDKPLIDRVDAEATGFDDALEWVAAGKE